MKIAKQLLAVLLLAGSIGGALAVPYAVVDAVQSPAWVERGERRLPLAPGMELQNRDRLITGMGARVTVQLSEGSLVKIGEMAQVGVNALGQRENQVFTAALDVVKGAFRLTTDMVRRYQSQRAINVRVGTVTAGIRGTDIWGATTDDRDFVCLLEGHIVATHPEGQPTELTQPLQYYGADRGKEPGLATAERTQAALWGVQTELQVGVGGTELGGRWAISLATLGSEDEALALYDRAMNIGQAVKVVPQRAAKGSYRYELRVLNIADEHQAELLANRLTRQLALAAPATVLRR